MIRERKEHGGKSWKKQTFCNQNISEKKICVQKVSEVDKIRGKNIKVNVAVAPQRCGLGAK